jgi:hypothetical protein
MRERYRQSLMELSGNAQGASCVHMKMLWTGVPMVLGIGHDRSHCG